MAETTLASGSVTQKWDRQFLSEYVRDNRLSSYMGSATRNSMMPIIIKRELTAAGKIVNIPLIARLKGGGRRGNNRLTGFEEALANFNHPIGINFNRNAVKVNRPAEHWTEMDLREAARMGLRGWAAESLRDDLINALMAYDGGARVGGRLYTDETPEGLSVAEVYASYSESTKDDYLAANTDRFLFGAAVSNHSANDHSAALLNIDTAADRMSAAIVSLAKERAKDADPHIRPFKTNDANGEEWFVMFLGARGMRDAAKDATILAANKDARVRGTDNPIFTAGDLVYDGVILREVPEFPVLAGVGASTTDVGFAALCGAQAVGVAWGQEPASRVKKEDDYGFEYGVAIEEARGVSKILRDGVQHGMVSVFHSAPASA